MPNIISNIPWITFIALFIVFFTSCNKQPPDPGGYDTFYFPPEVSEFFSGTVGEERIYRDSATGVYDTARCEYVRHNFIKSTFKESVLFEEESFSYSFYHTYYRYDFNYISRLARSSDGTHSFYVTENGEAYLLRFPLVIGDSINNGYTSSYSVLKAYYPTIEIGNKTFENVYFFKRNAMTARFGSDADYYLAKNRGIVAIREYKSNKLWILQ